MAQFSPLSNREWEVVKLLLQGKSNKLIASSLGISDRTVEFHLKNIYAKFQVNSRVELILKLGSSTVDSLEKSADNRDKSNSQMDSVRSNTTSIIGKELEMKNLLVGVITALFIGFVWLTMLIYIGSISLSEIKIWALPLIVILIIIGLSVGLIGKRNGNTLRRIFFSTLFGTGLSPFLIIPLMFVVVLPLGKLAE